MANGLLGKKVVNSRDTELVYTVPSARTATFNVNVLNNGSASGNVFLYVSDKEYQSADFEDYNEEDDVWTVGGQFPNPMDVIGFSDEDMIVLMGNASLDPTNPGVARSEIVPKKIEVDNTAGTVTIGDFPTTRQGNPLPWLSGQYWYVRMADTGAVFRLDTMIAGSGNVTAGTNYGLTDGNNNMWATNVDGPHAVAYTQGPAASGSVTVNTCTDYRSTSQTYQTSFTPAYTISHIAGVKTSEERFLTGTVFGQVYISTDGTPETASEFQSGGTLQVSSVTGSGGGNMIGAVAIEGSTENEGTLYIALSSNRVVYAGYTASTVVDAVAGNYSVFDFPTDVTYDNILDVRADGNKFVLIEKGGKRHETLDNGLTWTSGKHYPTIPFNLSLDATGPYKINGIGSAEITLVRGRTYRFFAQSLGADAPLFSATEDGTHGGGTTYSTGITYNMGNPTSTADFAVTTTDSSTYTTDYGTYSTQPKMIEFKVAADAPDTLYVYSSQNAGKSVAISVIDEPTGTPHDTKTLFLTSTIWNSNNGDANKKYDIFFDGSQFSREERFYELPEGDLYDKAGLGSGALLERTGVMASAGEQVIVKTDGEKMVVRVHGIEE